MNRYISSLYLLMLVVIISLQARVLQVGPSKKIKDIVEAAKMVQDGDTVEIDGGLYTNQTCTWSVNNTVIRGTTKYAHLKAPSVISNQKAILVITGNNTVIENIEFSDASVPDKNGAGIRQEGQNVVIRNCYFHHCEDGILGGKGAVTIEYSEFAFCGYGDGYSHNMYISKCDTFTLRFCYTHDVKEGHTIKSRALRNYIHYNRIESANSTASYEVNLPNGGTSFIIGNQIQQGTNSHNSAIIDFGSEGLDGHDSTLYVINNTIVNDRGSGTYIAVRNTQKQPKVYNNIFTGGGTVCSLPMDSAGNYIGENPGFNNKESFDYHLISRSPARNLAVDPGVADTYSLMPFFEYVHNSSGRDRIVSRSRFDAGAYMYSDANLAFQPKLSNSTKKKIELMHWYDLQGRRVTQQILNSVDPQLKEIQCFKFH